MNAPNFGGVALPTCYSNPVKIFAKINPTVKLELNITKMCWELNPLLNFQPLCVFSARQHSALYAIARPSVRLSVCLSVCHTRGSVKDG